MRRSLKRIPQLQITQQQQQQPSSSQQLQIAQAQHHVHNVTTSFQPAVRSFIIRPSNLNLNINKPLLILINPKSGGNLGNKLLKKFMWLLNPRQIFDLSQMGNPKFAYVKPF